MTFHLIIPLLNRQVVVLWAKQIFCNKQQKDGKLLNKIQDIFTFSTNHIHTSHKSLPLLCALDVISFGANFTQKKLSACTPHFRVSPLAD